MAHSETQPAEFRMTYRRRLLATFLLVPIGAIFLLIDYGASAAASDGGQPASRWFRDAVCAAVGVPLLYIWIHYGVKRYSITAATLTLRTIFGRTEIKFGPETEFYHDASTVLVPLVSGVEGLTRAGGELAKLALGSASRLLRDGPQRIFATVWEGGNSISIDGNVKSVGNLRRALVEAELTHVLPALKAALAAGDDVHFGRRIQIHGRTLTAGGQATLRTDVAAQIRSRHLELVDQLTGERLFASPIDRLPNYHSLIALVGGDG